MLREMAKSKIHRATVTEANLNYEGSITVDADLLATADILPGEKVQVVNIANGARFETYAIEGEAGSGIVCVNGAAARLTQPGDLVIIITYCHMEDAQARGHRIRVILVDGDNRPLADLPAKG
ncbi:MAG: aspartate 1-decarboxylase [Fibrobacteria bacterium]|nr:aspartate 1-decarboxylase [Fibrobacteria bacterium]